MGSWYDTNLQGGSVSPGGSGSSFPGRRIQIGRMVWLSCDTAALCEPAADRGHWAAVHGSNKPPAHKQSSSRSLIEANTGAAAPPPADLLRTREDWLIYFLCRCRDHDFTFAHRYSSSRDHWALGPIGCSVRLWAVSC